MKNPQNKKVNIVLQKRDLKILEFLAKFGFANDKHIMQMLGLAEICRDNYQNIIRRLIVNDYVNKERLVAGEYAYLLLGKRGADLLAANRVKKLVLNTLRHDTLVLDIYFDLLAKNPEYQITSERELRIAAGLKVGDKTTIPDLLINDKIAIEVELSEKSNARLIEIVGNYIRDVNLEEIHYFVKSKTLGHKILELAGWHRKFKVFLVELKSKDLAYTTIYEENSKTTCSATGIFDLDEYLRK